MQLLRNKNILHKNINRIRYITTKNIHKYQFSVQNVLKSEYYLEKHICSKYQTIKLYQNKQTDSILVDEVNIPKIGLGTWEPIEYDEMDQIIHNAINSGYCLFDMAQRYNNEELIGNAFMKYYQKKNFKKNRKNYIIATKLSPFNYRPEKVREATLKSLSDLKMDYIDIYFMHFPLALSHDNNNEIVLDSVPLYDTWRALEELVDEGLVRFLGLSNFSGALMNDLFTYAKYPPIANQIELHPYLTQHEMVKYCHDRNMAVIGYQPLGSPGYVKSGVDEQIPITPLLDQDVIKSIAEEKNKTCAQILLRWSIERDCIVIPKSSNLNRMQENINIFDFELSKNEIEMINRLNCNHRFSYHRHFKVGLGVPLYW